MAEVEHWVVRQDVDVIESCLRTVKRACKRTRTPIPEGIDEEVNLAMQHLLVAAAGLGGDMAVVDAVIPFIVTGEGRDA